MIGEAPRPITEITSVDFQPTATGLPELDRVLGGGIVTGSVTLVGGEPGIGKSTLLLQAAAALAKQGKSCLYVSAEESSEQVRLCLLYTSPSPRDRQKSRMPSSA